MEEFYLPSDNTTHGTGRSVTWQTIHDFESRGGRSVSWHGQCAAKSVDVGIIKVERCIGIAFTKARTSCVKADAKFGGRIRKIN
tara:strand:+ start:127 stop:378 length:252 start_codon:yes stop_codon:yes gene_type:complete